MITVHRKVLEEIIADLISTNDFRMLVQKYSYEKVFYYYLFKDIARGSDSPNYKIFQKVVKKKRVSEGFVIDQAKSILRYLSPDDRPDLVEYYETLGVTKDSTEEEIRNKWLELMKTHHPDKVGDVELETVKKINEAYEELRNSQKQLDFHSRHLPDIPIIVTEGSFRKNITYAVPFLLVVIVSLVYLSSSLTIFKSDNENEEIAALLETSSPNLTDSQDEITEQIISDRQDEPVLNPPEMAVQAEKNAIDLSKTFADLKEQGDLASFSKAGNIELVVKAEKNIVDPSKTLAELKKQADEDSFIKVEDILTTDNIAQKLETVERSDETQIASSNIIGSDQENEKNTSVQPTQYVVKSGDSLWTISRRFDITPQELLEFNTLASNELDIGDKLLIPAQRAELHDSTQKPPQEKRAEEIKKDQKAQFAALEEKTEDKKTVGTPTDSPPDQKNTKTSAGSNKNEYVVKSGDSIWTISRKFKITTEQLLAFNNLSDDNLDIGDKLLIPTNEDRVIISKSDPSQSKKILKDKVAKTESNKGESPETNQSRPVQPGKSVDKKIAGKLKGQPAYETPTNVEKAKELGKELKPVPDKPITARTTEVNKTKNTEPSVGADKASLHKFVSDYVTAYRNRNISRIKSLFAPDGLENGVEVSKVIRKYEENFSSVDLKKYEMNVRNIELDGQNGFVTGDFNITYAHRGKADVKSSRGSITWSVDWNNKGWEIKELNYKIVSTD